MVSPIGEPPAAPCPEAHLNVVVSPGVGRLQGGIGLVEFNELRVRLVARVFVWVKLKWRTRALVHSHSKYTMVAKFFYTMVTILAAKNLKELHFFEYFAFD